MQTTNPNSLRSRAERVFRSGGELARLCRDKDWSKTPLGPVDSWPISLCTIASLVVASPTPMIVLWGPRLAQIYNDGYREVMGEKHPRGLGAPTRECWPEVWEFNEPIFEDVFYHEKAFQFENQPLVLERNGYLERLFLNLTFSPALDDDGCVGGVLVTVAETTEAVERQRVEEALRESEQRLSRALDIETVGVLFFDMQSTFLDANDTFLHMTGLQREALERGELSSELVTRPEWMPRTLHAFKELKHNGRFTPYEKELIRPDGTRWWGLFAGAQLSENECVEFVIDVTAHRQAEQARYESETRFHAIADLVPDLLWQADPDGQRVWVNHRWVEYTGQTPGEAAGYGWADIIHPDEREAVLHKHRRAMETGTRFRNQHRMRQADGSYRWYLIEAVPIYGANGEIMHWFGSANDIHDQRETMDRLEELVAERTQSLSESEARFRLIVTTSAQIIWSTDAEGGFIEDSPSWRAFTGQSSEQWLSGEFGDMVHPEDLPDTLKQWRHSIETSQHFFIEYRLWHASSETWRWVVVHGVPLWNGQGQVVGWFGTCTDIDERKRAEEEIRRMAYSLTMAEQEERRRVSQVLHDDLQQLLYALQLKLRMVSGRLQSENSVLAHVVEDTCHLIKRAIGTTRQLTVDLSPPILKSEGLADALEWLQRQMLELHGLEIELRAEQDAPPLDEDLRVLLFQIVRELLFNVKKHAGVDYALVELGKTDRFLVIRVMDKGKGAARIETGELQGTGFGLSGIRERLRQVGGRIDIESAPGYGTNVTIHVPWHSDWSRRDGLH